LGYLWAIFFTT